MVLSTFDIVAWKLSATTLASFPLVKYHVGLGLFPLLQLCAGLHYIRPLEVQLVELFASRATKFVSTATSGENCDSGTIPRNQLECVSPGSTRRAAARFDALLLVGNLHGSVGLNPRLV
ncbi:hypothetical protein RRG08_060938 [Elysia crispata]|uniref:Uncharacterized protein n=1 Tax=Elysia crispata TaxID=231223 RepID=A0AAE1E508_9GAST|nr:hypothetical protein RRG08_060938 [Elysia crispata]